MITNTANVELEAVATSFKASMGQQPTKTL
jgi:hypothetical protein